jgi:hypothetical protein
MKRRRKLWILAATLIGGVYLLLPFVAGILYWGDRSGPVIYPIAYHEVPYRLGYILPGRPKPRIRALDEILTRRPFFYGMQRRLVSRAEYQEILGQWTEDGGERRATLLRDRYTELAATIEPEHRE